LLLFGVAVAGGCAGKAAAPPAAPADSPRAAPSDDSRGPRGGAHDTLTVRPVELEQLEKPDAFPCPKVDEDDPDYIPCDGGRR
jgi:hypothetical protein